MYKHEMDQRKEMVQKIFPFLLFLILSILTVAIYVPAFDAPFVFDSIDSIQANKNARDLSWKVTNDRRWLPIMTFALNYKMFDGQVWGYHLFNCLVHTCAALALYGVVNRTLLLFDESSLLFQHRSSIALFSCLVWFVHPLQTQSVIYTVQRMESMMGLFLFLSLYGFIRAVQGPRKFFWLFLSVVCCYLSACSKEVAVSIPFIILLYDYVFSSRSTSSVSNEQSAPKPIPNLLRIAFYIALFCSFLHYSTAFEKYANYLMPSDNIEVATGQLSDSLESSADTRVSAVIDVEGLDPILYAANQPAVILYYLKRSIVPINLCLDHGWPIQTFSSQLLPIFLVPALLILGIVLALRRHPIGFVTTCFFLVLAPTSSFLPIMDLCYEHRMYVPLAPIVVTAICLVFYVANKISGRTFIPIGFCLLLILVCTVLSHQRCQVYRTAIGLWEDVVEKAPNNPRGYMNRGTFRFYEKDDYAGALNDFKRCVEILEDPEIKLTTISTIENAKKNIARVYSRLGQISLGQNKLQQGLENFETALEYWPDFGSAHTGMGHYHFANQRFNDAAKNYRRAIDLDPEQKEVIENLLGQSADALKVIEMIDSERSL